MLGERLKLKRQADRLSLQEFAELLGEYDINITKGALSTYETGKALPSPEILTVMRQVLSVSPAFLEQETPNLALHYYLHYDLPPRRQTELDSYVTVLLEKRILIDSLLQCGNKWVSPERYIVRGPEDLAGVDSCAEKIRSSMGLGIYPICSVTNLLESLGWDIFELPKAFGVKGAVGYDQNHSIPFLYYPVQAGVVNVRMQLLALAAYAYLDIQDENLDREARRRFAASLLLSKEQALSEFGQTRTAIGAEELNMVKFRYGLPKYEIMARLLDLGIIDRQLYRNYMSRIRQQGYPSSRDTMAEPLFFYENSVSYKMKLQYAIAEKKIPEDLGLAMLMPGVHGR